jgi:hypothetical protein
MGPPSSRPQATTELDCDLRYSSTRSTNNENRRSRSWQRGRCIFLFTRGASPLPPPPTKPKPNQTRPSPPTLQDDGSSALRIEVLGGRTAFLVRQGSKKHNRSHAMDMTSIERVSYREILCATNRIKDGHYGGGAVSSAIAVTPDGCKSNKNRSTTQL